MAYRLAPQAETDLLEIWHYVATHANVEIADRLIDTIAARFFLLAAYPRAGRERDELGAGIRSFVVAEYVVLYRVEGDDVLIDRVVHGSRDLESLLGD